MFKHSSTPQAVLAIGGAEVGLMACSAKPQADPRTQPPLVGARRCGVKSTLEFLPLYWSRT
jgi:hypothetical protein